MSARLNMPHVHELADAILRGETSIDRVVESLTPLALEAILYEWDLWALPHQRPPRDDFFVWVLFGGRGSGKTHAAAKQFNIWARDSDNFKGGYGLLAGKTYEDVRKYQIEGKSGILATQFPDNPVEWSPGNQELYWPKTKVKAIIATGDKPKTFHGPTVAKFWADELARWQHPRACWEQGLFMVREADNPQVIVTTTPSTDPLIAELEDECANEESGHVMTRGPLVANPYTNPRWKQQMLRKFGGTRQGREALLGEVLRDHRGALFLEAWFDQYRLHHKPEMDTIVVSVDPIGTDDTERKARKLTDENQTREAGIQVLGRNRVDGQRHAYQLQDCSIPGRTEDWAKAAVEAYKRWQADKVLGEINFGGDMVRAAVHAIDPNVPFEMVRASRSKRLRAEPVAVACERGSVHMVGVHPELEKQCRTWVPGKSDWSPDRLDAFVHGVTHLLELNEQDEEDHSNPLTRYL